MRAGGEFRIWVHSDLQLSEPELAARTLGRALDDIFCCDLQPRAVWCLGDALCGGDLGRQQEVALMYVSEMQRLEVPVRYVAGNHEMDLLRVAGINRMPLQEIARQEACWRTTAVEEFFFTEVVDDTLVVFLGDHAALDGRWWTTNGAVRGDALDYPHTIAAFEELREKIECYSGAVVLASHYSLPGGERANPLLAPLLPLPQNVLFALHGHAHIGDLVHNKFRPWERVSGIDETARLQYNVSALETVRSPGSHSAFLEWQGGKPYLLRIRCHEKAAWIGEFPLDFLTC